MYDRAMDLEAEINSIKKRLDILDNEAAHMSAKLNRLIDAKKVLTEVMMTLVAEVHEELSNYHQ